MNNKNLNHENHLKSMRNCCENCLQNGHKQLEQMERQTKEFSLSFVMAIERKT